MKNRAERVVCSQRSPVTVRHISLGRKRLEGRLLLAPRNSECWQMEVSEARHGTDGHTRRIVHLPRVGWNLRRTNL